MGKAAGEHRQMQKFLNLATALYSLFTLRGVVPLLTNRDKKVIKEAAEKGKSRREWQQ